MSTPRRRASAANNAPTSAAVAGSHVAATALGAGNNSGGLVAGCAGAAHSDRPVGEDERPQADRGPRVQGPRRRAGEQPYLVTQSKPGDGLGGSLVASAWVQHRQGDACHDYPPR